MKLFRLAVLKTRPTYFVLISLLIILGWPSIAIAVGEVCGTKWKEYIYRTSEMAFGNNVYVGITKGDTLVSSEDGISWTERRIITNAFINDVIWDGAQFVAVGASGGDLILTSSDGVSWQMQSSSAGRVFGENQSLYGVATNGTVTVAVGFEGTILTSQDGNSWQEQNSNTSQDFFDIAWNGSLFIAVGGEWQTSTAIYTSPDGITWTSRADNLSSRLDHVEVMSDGTVIAVTGERDGTTAYSTDGMSWTSGNIGNIGSVKTLSSSGSALIAKSAVTNSYFVSGDGINWTENDKTNAEIQAANGQFFKVEDTEISTSTDGISWQSVYDGVPGLYNDVLWDGTFFYAAGDNGIDISSDGISWTRQSTHNLIGRLHAITKGENGFVAVGSAEHIMYSADGITWILPRNKLTGKDLYDATWNGSVYVAVGSDGRVLTSSNGTSWSTEYVGSGGLIYGITARDNILYAVISKGSSGGAILSSSDDGVSWSEVYTDEEVGYSDIFWNGTQFLAIAKNRVLLSSDGITWEKTDVAFNTSGSELNVFWGDNEYIVAAQGKNFTSSDGINWTKQNVHGGGFTGTGDWVNAYAWDGSKYIGVSRFGNLISSENESTFDGCLDLSLAVDAPAEISADTDISFTLTATNNTLSLGAIDPLIRLRNTSPLIEFDTLPEGCVVNEQKIECSAKTLAAGSTLSFIFNGHTSSSYTTETLSAIVLADQSEISLQNNSIEQSIVKSAASNNTNGDTTSSSGSRVSIYGLFLLFGMPLIYRVFRLGK